jgi:hypothetical protein
VPDYSEFPTTPTRWQEIAWQDVAPLPVEDPPPPPPRRGVDLTALVPGVVFTAVALLVLVGLDLPEVFAEGALLWLVLVGAGLALLVSEVRKARRRRT